MTEEPSLRELKSRGQVLKPAVRLGKAGVTREFLAEFERELSRVGLVKLRFEGLKDQRKTLSRELADRVGARLVMQVGHTAVFYRAAVGMIEA